MDIIKVVLKIMGSSMAVMFLELYMSIFFEKTESPLVTYESDSKKKTQIGYCLVGRAQRKTQIGYCLVGRAQRKFAKDIEVLSSE